MPRLFPHSVLNFTFRYILFWIITFSVFKLTLIWYYLPNSESLFQIPFISIISSLRFDISILSFMILLNWTSLIFIPKTNNWNCFKWINYIFIFIHHSIAWVDLGLYRSWQSRIHLKALIYLNQPFEIIKNISLEHLVMIIGGLILSIWLSIYLFNILFKSPQNTLSLKSKLLLTPIITVFLFFGVRGGWQQIPLNSSFGFVTQNNLLNYSVINPLWNVANILFEKNRYLTHNPYKKLSDDSAQTLTQSYYSSKNCNSPDLFLLEENAKPNICFLVLEGVNEVCVASYMPFMQSLKSSSIYFSNCYANGYRTEQGLTSILSGEIPLPYGSILDNIPSIHRYPSLFKDFKLKNYFTQFYFGGESEFGNIKSYLNIHNVSRIIDIHDFPFSAHTQRLGVNDSILLETLGDNLDQIKTPFLNVTMTQSTHEPFDIERNKSVTSEKEQYLNSVSYLDQCLARFFKNNAFKPWFQNTIFIILSDHSLRLPENYDNTHREFFKIPLWIYSQKMNPKYKGTIASTILNQTDIPATLHAILNQPFNQYQFSRNYFDTTRTKFAHVSFVDGSGIIDDTSYHRHDYRYKFNDSTYFRLHQKGYAILQYISQRFRESAR